MAPALAQAAVVAALIVGLIVAVTSAFAVPGWTLADIGAFSAVVDYAFVFLLALVPGAIVAALAFIIMARRCTSRNAVVRSRRMLDPNLRQTEFDHERFDTPSR